MENSCREEGELSDDENEDVIITHTLSAEAVKSKSNDQVIVIDDDDDYGDNSPGLMSHEVQVGSKPLSALNSLTQNTIEPKSYKRENVGSHRKKHKKSSDSKYRQIKHRNEGGTYEMKRSSVIKNNLSGSRKKAPEEIHRKTSNSNISGQSGFMDKMRGRYKYQGSGTMGDLLKTRSSLKVKHNISINPNDSTERKHTSKKVNSQNVQKSEVTVALESSPDRSMCILFVDKIVKGYFLFNCEYAIFCNFYPTALKGCQGIIFTHCVRMGRWMSGRVMGKVCLGCISEPLGIGS